MRRFASYPRTGLLTVCFPAVQSVTLTSQRLPRFLLTAALLYVGWYLLYSRLIHSSSLGYSFDSALCHHIAQASAWVLRLAGFESFAGGADGTFLHLGGYHVVTVGWQCDGLPMMALFAGFVLAYPGPWRTKLWFIPAGVLFIHGINVLRVVGLALNQMYWRSSMEFNHHYTFTIIVYGFIFWLWTIWVRRFANSAPASQFTRGDDAGPAAPAATPTSPSASVNA